MTIPDLTALQFKIIEILRGREMKGRDLREKLAEAGLKLAGPAFYQAMSRLEENGFVRSTKVGHSAMSTPVVATRYRVTGTGERAFINTIRFYSASLSHQRNEVTDGT